ncbi:TPA: hypothetical protein NDU34_005442 [Pseudomonas aeruginosa]|nr:hypothetical protein [Pseudomonas aeruginosa]HCD7569639.1 hypothetical protein [Pseudomonas aeruginosa]
MEMTALGWLTLIAFAICVPWWFYENYKQRPLSEFPGLDESFKLFPEDLRAIHRKGTMSRAEHLRYLKDHLRQISSEIRRRERYDQSE